MTVVMQARIDLDAVAPAAERAVSPLDAYVARSGAVRMVHGGYEP